MTRDDDFIGHLEGYLEEYEGSTPLPNDVRDAIRAALPSTQQRPAWLPAWRTPTMNRILPIGLGAAAVVIVAILGYTFLVPAGPSIGGPEETPTPTASPMAWPGGLGEQLAAGTYRSDGPIPVRVVVTAPEGWIVCGTGTEEFAVCSGPIDPRAVEVMLIDNVVSDPCDSSGALLDPPVGDSVDDLVTAVSNLSGFETTDPIDITLDGFTGKELELTAPTEPACVLDDGGLGTWSRANGGGTNGLGPGEVNLLRIVDVDGVRVMIAAAYHPAVASADEVTELRAVFDSVHIAP